MRRPRLPRPLAALAIVLPLWLGACQLLLDISDPEVAVADRDAALVDGDTGRLADAELPDGAVDATGDSVADAFTDAAIDADLPDATVDADPAAPDACAPRKVCSLNQIVDACTGRVVQTCGHRELCCTTEVGPRCQSFETCGLE
jgi:hypothetical protein